LVDNEDVGKIFQENNMQFKTKMVLFNGAVKLPVEMPHLLPFIALRSKKVYMDLAFEGLENKIWCSREDFATAYVIAHEIGHHVQTLRYFAK
jgi:predicted metalloprotease